MTDSTEFVSVFGTHTVLQTTLGTQFDWVHHDDGLYVFTENADDIIAAITTANIVDDIDYVVRPAPDTSGSTNKEMWDFKSDKWVPYE